MVFPSAKAYCDGLGMRLPIPADQEEQRIFADAARGPFWLGLEVANQLNSSKIFLVNHSLIFRQARYTSIYSGEAPKWTNWRDDGLDGARYEGFTNAISESTLSDDQRWMSSNFARFNVVTICVKQRYLDGKNFR